MAHFYPAERLGAFIDGANLHGTARALGFAIDYKRLLSHLRAKGQLVRIYYYTVVVEDDEEYSSIRPLVDWLDYNGFSLVTKRGREHVGDDGRRRLKGNMDVHLAVDAITLAAQLDHVMLFSGDGDFRALVADLQLRGLRVSVVSTLRSQPPMAADELRRQADQFIDLADLEGEIGRDPPSRSLREPAARPAVRRRGAISPGPDASEGGDC